MIIKPAPTTDSDTAKTVKELNEILIEMENERADLVDRSAKLARFIKRLQRKLKKMDDRINEFDESIEGILVELEKHDPETPSESG